MGTLGTWSLPVLDVAVQPRTTAAPPYPPGMSKLNNPAGRLHNLLRSFDQLASRNMTINDVWCAVLEVEPSTLLPRLGQTAELLEQIRAAVDRSGRQELEELHSQFAPAWAVPIFAHGRNPATDYSEGLVEGGALVALGSLSMVLEFLAPDGHIPDEDTERTLSAELDDLLEALREDTELPSAIRAAIVARVHDIRWAIDHVQVLGPDGVQAAIERLVGHLTIFTVGEPQARKAGVFRRTMEAAGHVWWAFRAPGEAHQALETWQAVWEILPPS